MTMPNFFIIGAQKAGTTSLYHYLNQHPQIYMSPVKEPRFFCYEIDFDGRIVDQEFGGPRRRRPPMFPSIEDYCRLFRTVRDETAIGEASPSYIYIPGTAERIKRYVPEARIIALLRNPADRAYSSFLNSRRYGKEPLTDFAQAVHAEEGRIRDNWHYVYHYRNKGLYHAQLGRYYKVFGRKRIGVWLFEDLKNDPVGVVQSVLRFLEVDHSFIPDTSSKHNPAAVPTSGLSRAMMRVMDKTAAFYAKTFTSNSRLYMLGSKTRQRVQSWMLAKPPPIDPEIRKELIGWYREDILKLQQLIGRDLSAWLDDEDMGSRNKDRREVNQPLDVA